VRFITTLIDGLNNRIPEKGSSLITVRSFGICYGRRKDFFKYNVNKDVKVTSKREE